MFCCFAARCKAPFYLNNMYVYLDDILILGHSQEQVRRHTDLVLRRLRRAGMVVNLPKSSLEPSQRLEHLGVFFDFKKGRLTVPPKKLKSSRKDFGQFAKKSEISLRKAATVLGKVKALLVAVPALRAFCSLLQGFINHAPVQGWDACRRIPLELPNEVCACNAFLHNWRVYPFWILQLQGAWSPTAATSCGED